MQRFVVFAIMAIFIVGCANEVNSINSEKREGNKIFYEKKSEIKKEDIFLRLDTGGHMGAISDIIVTKSEDIITCSNDKTIRVWNGNGIINREKRKILGEIGDGSKGKIYAMALSPNEKFLAVGGYLAEGNNINSDLVGVIRIYDYKYGKLIKILKSHNNSITDLAFSSDGKYLISGSLDKTAKIWEVEKFHLRDTIKFDKNDVFGTRIIKKMNRYFAVIIGFGVDNKIMLYDIDKRKIVKLKKIAFKPLYIDISKQYIAVSGLSNQIKIYNYNLEIKKTIKLRGQANQLAYSQNEDFFISGEVEQKYNSHLIKLNIYDVKNNYRFMKSFDRCSNLTTAIAFLNNETVIHAGGNNHSIYIWSVIIPTVFKKIREAGEAIWSVGINGDKIAWGNQPRDVFIRSSLNLEEYINLKTFQINFLKKNKFHEIPTSYKNYKLSHRRGGELKRASGILDIKRNNKTIASIIGDLGNGGEFICYGFYKNYIVAGLVGKLKIYNLNGEEIANLVGHIDEVWSIALDGDKLISGGADQTIRVWDLSKLKNRHSTINEPYLISTMKINNLSKKEVLKMAQERNNLYNRIYIAPNIKPQISIFVSKMNSFDGTHEWIAWTPEGYFSTSQNGVKYLYFHLNHGVEHEAEAIPMERLYDHFFRPDLVKLKLAGEEEAYKKAIGKLDYREALKNPPPTVKIDEVNRDTSKDKIKLSFNVHDEGGGVGLIRIYQEGKLIQTIGDGEIKRQSANIDTVLEQEKKDTQSKEMQKVYIAKLIKNSKYASIPNNLIAKTIKPPTTTNRAGEYTIEVDLKSGKNEIAIEAFNKTNTVASYRESVTVNAHIPKRKPKLYAIVAGVNSFQSEAGSVNPLKYSENDAKAIKEAVEKRMKTVYSDIEVIPLIGKRLTKANILAKAKEISTKAKLEDTVLFYISTHGRAIKGKLYLVPYNNRVGTDWINFEDTFKAIQSIKALNQIFVIDACESGQANDIVSAVYDSKASVLAKQSGVHMLLATTKGTSAFESNDPNIKNGVFTHRVLTALENRATDINRDGFITVKEVSKELRKPQSNTDFQYPVIRNVGSDVRLEKL